MIDTAAYCSYHKKWLYGSRAKAKAVIRELHSPGMREYRCRRLNGYFHIGHLPDEVRRGEMDMLTWQQTWRQRNGFGRRSPASGTPAPGAADRGVDTVDPPG